MRTASALTVLLLLSGCAGGIVECHGVDWYQAGRRDAMLDGRDEAERIAASCGSAFDAKRYRQGFDEGAARKPKPNAK